MSVLGYNVRRVDDIQNVGHPSTADYPTQNPKLATGFAVPSSPRSRIISGHYSSTHFLRFAGPSHIVWSPLRWCILPLSHELVLQASRNAVAHGPTNFKYIKIQPTVRTLTSMDAAKGPHLQPSLSSRITAAVVTGLTGVWCKGFLYGLNQVEVIGLDKFLRLLESRQDVEKRQRGLITGSSCLDMKTCYLAFQFLADWVLVLPIQ